MHLKRVDKYILCAKKLNIFVKEIFLNKKKTQNEFLIFKIWHNLLRKEF
jgi:hypothetical protein